MTTLVPSVLIGLKFDKIEPGNAELATIERLEKSP